MLNKLPMMSGILTISLPHSFVAFPSPLSLPLTHTHTLIKAITKCIVCKYEYMYITRREGKGVMSLSVSFGVRANFSYLQERL